VAATLINTKKLHTQLEFVFTTVITRLTHLLHSFRNALLKMTSSRTGIILLTAADPPVSAEFHVGRAERKIHSRSLSSHPHRSSSALG
jgi:hypothetical protein